jgi:hypothetical protein
MSLQRYAVLVACLGLSALASDKGLKAEMVDASVTIFCTTSIAEDMKPIVDGEHHLAIAKMSQESLKQEQSKLNRLWAAVSEKHKTALAQLGLTPRLRNVERSYVEVAGNEAWGVIAKKCPERVKGAEADSVTEFLKRRIPEL